MFKAKRYWSAVLAVVALISLAGYLLPTEAQTSFLMLGQNSGTVKAIATNASGALSGDMAEDAAHTSGDLGRQVFGVRKETATQATSADGDYGSLSIDGYGALFARSDHPNRVVCLLSTTATTSTAITGCAAPGAGLAIYVADVAIYGGVATGATAAAIIQSGTGGTCGSATISLTACQHGATSGCVENSTIPARGVTNGEICITDATVGTKFVTIRGFIAP